MTLGWLNTTGARAFGMSDDQEDDEFRVHRRSAAAIAEMKAAIEDVNASSVLVEIEPSAFEAFLNDECPTESYWAEKLAIARAR
jgi:hypothetical protein